MHASMLVPNTTILISGLQVILLPSGVGFCLTFLLLLLLLQACKKHGVQPGVFCLGEQRAAELASMGYTNIAYNTDLSVLVNYTVSSMNKLKSSNFSI